MFVCSISLSSLNRNISTCDLLLFFFWNILLGRPESNQVIGSNHDRGKKGPGTSSLEMHGGCSGAESFAFYSPAQAVSASKELSFYAINTTTLTFKADYLYLPGKYSILYVSLEHSRILDTSFLHF